MKNKNFNSEEKNEILAKILKLARKNYEKCVAQKEIELANSHLNKINNG